MTRTMISDGFSRLGRGGTVAAFLFVVMAAANVRAANRVIDAQGNLYLVSTLSQGNAALTPNAFQKTFQTGICGYSYTFRPGRPDTQTPFFCRHGYVQKISPSGSTLLVGTYFGGSKDDSVGAIALDSSGNIYISGGTSSLDLPITPGAYQTRPGGGFLAVLSPDGSKLLYCTYLDFGGVIQVDRTNRVLIAGATSGVDFPATVPSMTNNDTGRTDAFIARFDPALSKLEFAMRFGGSMDDVVTDAALDQMGNLYVTGFTASTARNAGHSSAQPFTSFPITPGAYHNFIGAANTFVVKFDPAGSVLFSTAFGGSVVDQPTALSIDAAGNAHVMGPTYSIDFPVTSGAFRSTYSQGFAAKLSADGSQLLYATFLGATNPQYAAVNAAGELMVAGRFTPYTSNFPATPDSFQPCLNAAQSLDGGGDYFLQLSPEGATARYATILPPPVPLGSGTALIALDSNARVLLTSRTKLFDIFDARSRPAQGITCVANAATYRSGPVAGGEIVAIFGPSIGPTQPLSFQLADGMVGSSLGGVTVSFNGIPAPLLYVSENQINAIVPFGLAGQQQCSVQIVNQGVRLPAITLPVADSAIGIFTLDSSGAGQTAALNQDGTVNDYVHPAPRGSIVSVFVTGAGRMKSAAPDGSLGTGKTTPVLQFSGDLIAFPLEVLYVGDAPGLVQGVVQINFRVPARLYRTGYVPLNIRFGEGDSSSMRQAAVYLTVN